MKAWSRFRSFKQVSVLKFRSQPHHYSN